MISGIRIRPGPGSQSSWSIRLDTSVDGEEFEVAAFELEPDSVEAFVHTPMDASFETRFPSRAARFVRLTNPGLWAERWSIAEIAIY